MSNYKAFHERSVTNPADFWSEQAKLIHWEKGFDTALDYSNPPFAKWFVGGKTNLCYNAVDRHLTERGDQLALVAVSTETNIEQSYSFKELHAEINRMAAMMKSLGVQKGDRVLIYMPMIAEACFAMLACARIGAIHSVVFGGFAAHSLATRIDDAMPRLIVTAEAGIRNGKPVPYKPLLDEAIEHSTHKPEKVLIVNRGLVPFTPVTGRDVDFNELRTQHMDAQVPCEWLESNEPSYILYTSGTTGKPKGVQRDVGGYAVALAASMKHIYGGKAGETFFSTSDIGWVVGHSYIIYGPLIAGMGTIMYEGTPILPDAGIWWKLVEKYKVSLMFSAPTAARVLKKQDPAYLTKYDISSLRTLFLAGEPLDEPTANWIHDAIQKRIVDNYWQTETGWPILAIQQGIEDMPHKYGSPGVPVYGYNMKLISDVTGEECAPHEKGVVVIEGPLPPGCLQTVWNDDERYLKYWSNVPNRSVYSTFDWGIKDEDGYFFILGRTDDVINVAGHRLGTREIEECISGHQNIAEVAVVGVEDTLKGQEALAFCIAKDANTVTTSEGRAILEAEVKKLIDHQIGAVARPKRVYFVNALPKTRSGKLLRRAMQAVAENRDAGDLTTMEDPVSLQMVKDAILAG